MEATASSTTEATPPVLHPSSFHEVIRAILRCLGLEVHLQQSPVSSCPNKQDDDYGGGGTGKLNHNQHDSPRQTSDPPSSTDYSDPSTTLSDPPPPDDPPSTTLTDDRGGLPVISLFTPKRPGTGRGRGGQIN